MTEENNNTFPADTTPAGNNPVIPAEGVETIYGYFPELTERQRARFAALGTLYPEWNAKINVISRKDIANLYVNHVLHSLAIARFITPAAGTRFLDMGTGGGFPGIPLAIMFPDCAFHLIDRVGKKIKVARAVADAIGLENVTFQHGDIGECRDKYDFVVSRGVTRLDELAPLVRKNVSREQRNAIPNGLICLKGGDLADELRGNRKQVMRERVATYFSEPFFETKELVYLPMC